MATSEAPTNSAPEMAQEPQALPPSLAALLGRDDFASTIFESGRCAHSVGEAPGTIFELALDRLLAALDGDSTVSPDGGYGFPALAASYRQGLDFQLGRVNEKGGWDRFDLWKYQYENLPSSETARRALEGGLMPTHGPRR